MEIVRCTNGVGVWEVVSDNGSSQVFDLRSDAENFLKNNDHDCWDNAQPYEFEEDGHRFHGWECGICGELLQTG